MGYEADGEQLMDEGGVSREVALEPTTPAVLSPALGERRAETSITKW